MKHRRIRPILSALMGFILLGPAPILPQPDETKPPVDADDLLLWPMDEAINALAPQLVRWGRSAPSGA